MSSEQADSADVSVRAGEVGLAEQTAAAVQAYRDGDHRPLDELVVALTPLLWHTVRSQGADRDQAEDIVQNVWLALVREVDSIRDPRATLQWLLVTARRAAWRTVSRSREERGRTTHDEHAVAWLVDPTAPAGEAAERDERDVVLWHHLNALPDRCRKLLRLVALVDRPDYTSVSRALGMPVGSIGPTRGRCLAKLRLALNADPGWIR